MTHIPPAPRSRPTGMIVVMTSIMVMMMVGSSLDL
jgi:hypothetical protein